eukprot:683745-Amorphochlora_amoeboformis.AAC.1
MNIPSQPKRTNYQALGRQEPDFTQFRRHKRVYYAQITPSRYPELYLSGLVCRGDSRREEYAEATGSYGQRISRVKVRYF